MQGNRARLWAALVVASLSSIGCKGTGAFSANPGQRPILAKDKTGKDANNKNLLDFAKNSPTPTAPKSSTHTMPPANPAPGTTTAPASVKFTPPAGTTIPKIDYSNLTMPIPLTTTTAAPNPNKGVVQASATVPADPSIIRTSMPMAHNAAHDASSPLPVPPTPIMDVPAPAPPIPTMSQIPAPTPMPEPVAAPAAQTAPPAPVKARPVAN